MSHVYPLSPPQRPAAIVVAARGLWHPAPKLIESPHFS